MINLTITKLENGKYTGSIGNTPLIWAQNDFVIAGLDYAGTKMEFDFPIEVVDTVLERLKISNDKLYEGWYGTFIDDESEDYIKLQFEYLEYFTIWLEEYHNITIVTEGV